MIYRLCFLLGAGLLISNQALWAQPLAVPDAQANSPLAKTITPAQTPEPISGNPAVSGPLFLTPVTDQETQLLKPPRENYHVEALLSENIFAHGGFGAPAVKFTQIDGKTGVLVGGVGAWVINHSFLLGGGGYGLASPNIKRFFENDEKTLHFGYGGLLLGYILDSDRLVHFSFQTLLAGGGIGYHEDHNIGKNKDDEDLYEDHGVYDAFFVLDPMVYVELNITPWFRMSLGGGYRAVIGAEIADLDDRDLSGATAELLFKFGYF